MYLKLSSVIWRPFCPGRNELILKTMVWYILILHALITSCFHTCGPPSLNKHYCRMSLESACLFGWGRGYAIASRLFQSLWQNDLHDRVQLMLSPLCTSIITQIWSLSPLSISFSIKSKLVDYIRWWKDSIVCPSVKYITCYPSKYNNIRCIW